MTHALLLALALLAPGQPRPAATAPTRPNILWITCEDIGPDLGCYGVPHARTPNLDELASQAVRYTRAFAPIGVCAPARSTIITGMWPPSIGTQHMRCQGILPQGAREFPRYLRDAGYYCTNNVKTDYNFTHDPATWDESSPRAHWRNRPDGVPFFAVMNLTTTHESRIRTPEAEAERLASLSENDRHDPAEITIPPYHPDMPEVHRDWANYHDNITLMDRQVGRILHDLEADGLANSTIVFFYSDHGAGMPRDKRWLFDSSTRIPFMVRFPESLKTLAPGQPGSTTNRLIGFVDLAPTILSLARLELPSHFQGTAFLGVQAGEPRQYLPGFRDRMDERTDLIRSMRDDRYLYIANYLPQRPWFHDQHIAYMYEMPTMRLWQRLADEGRLQGTAALFMAKRKPNEELYDSLDDPHNLHNLAADPRQQANLSRLRTELFRWQTEIQDLGALPEPDLRTRFGSEPPYDAVRERPSVAPLDRIWAMARRASGLVVRDTTELTAALDDPDPAIRWWAATGLGTRYAPRMQTINQLNTMAMEDAAPWVRVASADALAALGRPDTAVPILADALDDPNPWTRLAAAQALDRLDARAEPARPELRHLAEGDANNYVRDAARHALDSLDPAQPVRP